MTERHLIVGEHDPVEVTSHVTVIDCLFEHVPHPPAPAPVPVSGRARPRHRRPTRIQRAWAYLNRPDDD